MSGTSVENREAQRKSLIMTLQSCLRKLLTNYGEAKEGSMAIKNYTTEVDVYKSLGEIQAALASHGARKIMVDYDAVGQPIGVMFAIETPNGPRGFCLPANVDGVRAVFDQQKVKAKPGQAERTAWRNIRDWIMAQMAIIEAGQVQLEEVFLPYLTDNRGKTLYQLYRGGQLALEGGS